MARALWTGSLSFGLVNVPVALYSAVRDVDLHFRQLHEKDAARIDTRRFCSEEDREIPLEEVGHAYDLDNGNTVVLTDAHLGAVAPRKTRTIDIEAFVFLADIDPVFFDHPYFLVPTGDSEGPRRAYQLLLEVMRRAERVALGRFVMRTKEYLVLVRPREGLLSLTTMRFHDEVRPTDGIAPGGRKPAKDKIEQAVAVIESLGADWDPERYTDCYRERLERIVDQKKKGKRVKAPAEPKEPKPAPDLMAALQETLERMGDGKKTQDGGTQGKGRKKAGTAS
jgi:DNA end-binding protein Ku